MTGYMYIVVRIQTELKAPGSYNMVQLITMISGRCLLLFKVRGQVHGTEMAKDAGLPEISGKFQICPVNPSSLSDNLSDIFFIKNNVELFTDLLV